MNSTAKILVPGQEWLVRTDDGKIGALSKSRKGYTFFKNGYAFGFKNLNDVKTQLGIELFEESLKKTAGELEPKTFAICIIGSIGNKSTRTFVESNLGAKPSTIKSMGSVGLSIINCNFASGAVQPFGLIKSRLKPPRLVPF